MADDTNASNVSEFKIGERRGSSKYGQEIHNSPEKNDDGRLDLEQRLINTARRSTRVMMMMRRRSWDGNEENQKDIDEKLKIQRFSHNTAVLELHDHGQRSSEEDPWELYKKLEADTLSQMRTCKEKGTDDKTDDTKLNERNEGKDVHKEDNLNSNMIVAPLEYVAVVGRGRNDKQRNTNDSHTLKTVVRVTLKGPLEKRGVWTRRFKWRYIELTRTGAHGHLCYYSIQRSDERDIPPLGIIPLLPNRAEAIIVNNVKAFAQLQNAKLRVKKSSTSNNQKVFIINTPVRAYEFRAATAEGCKKWVKAIKEIIGSAKTKEADAEQTSGVKRSIAARTVDRSVESRTMMPIDDHKERESNVIKEGFLDKKGVRSIRFKSRFFQLLQSYDDYGVPCLAYSLPKQARADIFLGVIPLVVNSCIVNMDVRNARKFSLLTPGRTYNLRAFSTSERDSWVVILSKILRQHVLSNHFMQASKMRRLQPKQKKIVRTFFVSEEKQYSTAMKTVLEGFLEKCKTNTSSFKFLSYRSRFFWLLMDTGTNPVGNLTYAPDQRSLNILGSIEIVPGRTLVGRSNEKRAFTLKNPNNKYYWLRANSESDRDIWIHSIKAILYPPGSKLNMEESKLGTASSSLAAVD